MGLFQKLPEYKDTLPDPMDRWSKREIGTIASGLKSKAVYPSDGPPYAPFYTWAVLSKKAFVSPLKLLVHEDVGLMISYRGALVLEQSIQLPVSRDKSPCEACSEQCISACPADAFSIVAYDTDACKSFLCSNTGQDK